MFDAEKIMNIGAILAITCFLLLMGLALFTFTIGLEIMGYLLDKLGFDFLFIIVAIIVILMLIGAFLFIAGGSEAIHQRYSDEESLGQFQRKSRVQISNKLKHEIWRRDKFTCQYCGRDINEVELEIDHIKPVSKGGTNSISNLQTLCFECNRSKSNK